MAELARAQGLVLHTHKYAETDVIAALLSRERGRLDVLAKGARRLERTSGAALDALNVVDVVYYRRRGGLHLLKEAALVRTFPRVREDWDRFSVALGALEWPLALLPREAPEPRVYSATLGFLAALERGGPPRVLRLAYALRVLEALGHGPSLVRCASCGKKQELTWVAERGGALCRGCGGVGEPWPLDLAYSLEALRRLPWTAAGRLRLKEDQLTLAEKLLAEFRAVQVGR